MLGNVTYLRKETPYYTPYFVRYRLWNTFHMYHLYTGEFVSNCLAHKIFHYRLQHTYRSPTHQSFSLLTNYWMRNTYLNFKIWWLLYIIPLFQSTRLVVTNLFYLHKFHIFVNTFDEYPDKLDKDPLLFLNSPFRRDMCISHTSKDSLFRTWEIYGKDLG